MVSLTTRRGFVLGAVTAPFVARFAHAQAFPSRPVRIVIGFPPGGGIDILARLIAPVMSERLGQPVIVDNRPGANGQVATQAVSQLEADGHTILFGTAVYIAASIACALAVSPEMLIGGRFVQALGACAGGVVSRAVVRDRFARGFRRTGKVSRANHRRLFDRRHGGRGCGRE